MFKRSFFKRKKSIGGENGIDDMNNIQNNEHNCKDKSKIRKKLIECDGDSVKLFSLDGMMFTAKVTDCYDGDSFKACFILNDEIVKFNCRADGYDSPEMRPRKNVPNRDEEIKKANEARYHFMDLIGFPNDTIVTLRAGKFDKYGRLLATIYKDDKSESINSQMIRAGYGYEYHGGTKRK